MATSTSNTAAAQKAIDEQNVYIRDTLMSVASKYAETLKSAVEDAFDSAEATTLSAVGKDLTRTFNRLAKMSDDFSHNTSRINAGIMKQKDLTKQLQTLDEKRDELRRKKLHADALGIKFSEEDYSVAEKSLDIQEKQLKADERQLQLVEQRIGLTGKLVQGLNKVPFIGKFFNTEEIERKMRAVAASGGGTFKTMGVAASEVGKQFAKGLTDPLTIATFLIESILKSNRQIVELGKSLGKSSYEYRENLASAVRFSNNVNFTTENLVGAFNELTAATGLAYEYSVDQLETQVKLTKQVGLQADEAAQIQRLSVLTGKSSEQTYNSFVKGLVAARNQFKVGINFKATLAEAAKVSGQLAANLGYNPERIAKAVVAAKAFGMTLDQVAKTGESLLNWESSIENELKAELITGRQLNLEKARYAALTGDQVALAEELNKQVGTSAEFTQMNVIQQKSLAEAVGMTTDELAETLRKREEALASGKSLAQITAEEAKSALERQTIQDKFNAAILKLQDFFGNLVAGPLGQFVSFLSQGLDYITAIAAGLGTIWAISKGIQIVQGITVGMRAAQLASEQGINAATFARRALLGSELAQTVAIATAWVIANPLKAIAGLALAAGVGALVYGAAKSGPKFAQGGIVSSEINNATIGEAGPEAIIPLNSPRAEKILGGGGQSVDLTPMINAINEVKAAINQLSSRPSVAYINGKDAFSKDVSTTSVQNTYKLA